MKQFQAYMRSLLVLLFILLVPTAALANMATTATCKNDVLAKMQLTEEGARHLQAGTLIVYNGRSLPLTHHVWGTCAELTSDVPVIAHSAIPATLPAPAAKAPVQAPVHAAIQSAPVTAPATVTAPAKTDAPKITTLATMNDFQPAVQSAPAIQQPVQHSARHANPVHHGQPPWYARAWNWATSDITHVIGGLIIMILGLAMLVVVTIGIAWLLCQAWYAYQDWRDRPVDGAPARPVADFSDDEEGFYEPDSAAGVYAGFDVPRAGSKRPSLLRVH